MRSRRVTKGRPACAAANATRPKQRLSNARQAAALECFATSSTDFGENSDVQQMSAQQEPQDEHDDPGRWSSSSLRRLSRVVGSRLVPVTPQAKTPHIGDQWAQVVMTPVYQCKAHEGRMKVPWRMWRPGQNTKCRCARSLMNSTGRDWPSR
ncbi:uncharacterized protein [Dermacentor albipictus]|uniref:uncharacterized protein isoform X1 n=1 Tax=Dermacentor albipictus TaxID=60249 RepID=UPI0038FD3D8B